MQQTSISPPFPVGPGIITRTQNEGPSTPSDQQHTGPMAQHVHYAYGRNIYGRLQDSLPHKCSHIYARWSAFGQSARISSCTGVHTGTVGRFARSGPEPVGSFFNLSTPCLPFHGECVRETYRSGAKPMSRGRISAPEFLYDIVLLISLDHVRLRLRDRRVRGQRLDVG